MKTNSPSIPSSLLEIYASDQTGFQPLVNTFHWRVGILNFSPDLSAQGIFEFQRHNESDELFVLLHGRCILFVGEGENEVTRVFSQDLEPFLLYNVKSRVWHTHVLSPDAKLLIVENQNTSPANSPRVELTPGQRADMIHQTRLKWKDMG